MRTSTKGLTMTISKPHQHVSFTGPAVEIGRVSEAMRDPDRHSPFTPVAREWEEHGRLRRMVILWNGKEAMADALSADDVHSYLEHLGMESVHTEQIGDQVRVAFETDPETARKIVGPARSERRAAAEAAEAAAAHDNLMSEVADTFIPPTSPAIVENSTPAKTKGLHR